MGDWKVRLTRAMCAVLISGGGACGGQPEDGQTSQTLEEQLAEIENAQVNPITTEEVAEAFALGSDSTDLQRDILKKQVVGSVVEWRVPVYEVELNEGLYKVTSQALPVRAEGGIPMLRAVIFVAPESHRGHEFMRKLKTNETILVRGKVQDIFLRSVVAVYPATLKGEFR